MKNMMMRVNANGRYETKSYPVGRKAARNSELVESYCSPYAPWSEYMNGLYTNSHWYVQNLFVSYETPICYRIGEHLICNAERYSTTTTTIQNKVIREALSRGYKVHYVEFACFMEMIYQLEIGINNDGYYHEYDEFLDSLEDNPLNLSMDDCKYIMSLTVESEVTSI